jgi:hypothetical protein
MRERSLDPATREQINTLASSILTGSSLQDPSDHRAQKLKEVLQYLQRRIGSMLDAGAPAGAMLPEAPAQNETHADNRTASADSPFELELPPLLAPALELPSEVSDSAGELQLDPFVIEPLPAAAAATALMPNRQSEIGAAAGGEPAEVPLTHEDADISEEHAAITPEPGEATTAEGPNAVLHDSAGEMATPLPSQSEQSTATADPPVVQAATASEDNQDAPKETLAEAPAESSTEPAATRSPPPYDPILDIEGELLARPTPRAAPSDPLAALKAMTDEERIALFT